MNDETIAVIGGPRCGKSWLARELRAMGYPTFCGDPIDKVKEPEAGVTYLREGMGMESESSRHIVDHWLPLPGPKVLEGHIMARVLRKWLKDQKREACHDREQWPCNRIIVFPEQHPDADVTSKQFAMHKGVIETTWAGVRDYFEGMTTDVVWSEPRWAGLTPEGLVLELGLKALPHSRAARRERLRG